MKSTKIMFVSLDILLTFLNGLSDLFPEIISFLIQFDLSFEEPKLQSCPSADCTLQHLLKDKSLLSQQNSLERVNSPGDIKVSQRNHQTVFITSGIVVYLGAQGGAPTKDKLKMCERLVCLGSWMLNAGMTSLCCPDVQKNRHCIQKGPMCVG